MSEAAVISRGTMNGNPVPAGSVLIIDDEAAIRESLQTLLEMEGFEGPLRNYHLAALSDPAYCRQCC